LVARLSGAAELFALVLLVSLFLTPKTLEAQEAAVLTCAFDNTQPLTEMQVSVTCSLMDNLGIAVADTPLTFYVNFEAGTDVAWDNGRKTAIKSTDGQGQVRAVLDAGKRPGSLGVLVNYPGIYSSFAFVKVEAAPVPAPTLEQLMPE